jgi:hypothetical protein
MFGWHFRSTELAEALHGRPSIERARPYEFEVVVDTHNVEAAKAKIMEVALDLQHPLEIERRNRSITSAVRMVSDHLEVCVSELSWLSYAGWISVIQTLRGHGSPMVLKVSSGVVQITPARTDLMGPVRKRVINVLEAKSRHVRVTAPEG